MADRSEKVTSALESIAEAVKAMKSIRENNQKLNKVTEEVKNQAYELRKIVLPDNERLKQAQVSLSELKKALESTVNSIRKLEQRLKIFYFETSQFESFVRPKLESGKFSSSDTQAMYSQLIKAHKISDDFASAFEDFLGKLSSAMAAAAELTSSLREQSNKLGRSVGSKEGWDIAGAAGLLVCGVGLAALGFFTGGTAWVTAGVVGAAGSATVGVKAAVDFKETQKLASDIVSGAKQLEGIAERMKRCCDSAGEILLDVDALKTLQLALNYFGKQKKKDEELASQDKVLEAQAERIAELEAEIGRWSQKGGAN